MTVYANSARYYDAIYRFKDYAGEVATLRRFIQDNALRPVATLLDVGCGTGSHLLFLQDYFRCTGLDNSADQLAVARERLPAVRFYEGDMRTFDLGQTFAAVVCLFSAIGYVKTIDGLRQALTTMARHVAPGGVLIVEPWLHPADFEDGHLSALYLNDPALKVARMSLNKVEGTLSIMNMHHLIATPEGVEYFTELHEMGLFTDQEYIQAIQDAGLKAYSDAAGIAERGLYVGVKPL